MNETYKIVPRAGGGWEPFVVALARKLAALDLGAAWVTLWRSAGGAKYFAHFGPDEDGALFTEVCGNYYIAASMGHADLLSDDQVGALVALGFGEAIDDPEGGDEVQPRNHTRTWPAPIDWVGAVAAVVLALVEVYGVSDHDELTVAIDEFR